MGVRHVEYQSAPQVGSAEWFAAKFNFYSERLKYIHHSGLDSEAAETYFYRELVSLFTENASGKNAMAIQRRTEYEIIKRADASIEMYLVDDLEQLGEQSKSFLDFSGLSPAITEGITKGFSVLADSNVGEGVVILSPADLYENDYDSVNDVLNPMMVTAVNESNGERRIRVSGWYLFINRKLDDQSRQFIHNLLGFDLNHIKDSHNPFLHASQSVSDRYSDKAEVYVSQPRTTAFSLVDVENNQLDDWSIFPWLEQLHILYSEAFPYREELFDHLDAQHELRNTAELLVSTHIGALIGMLHQGMYHDFFSLISNLVRRGQHWYAELLEENPEAYKQAYDAGQIKVAGGHPMEVGANLEIYWDAQADDWKGGTRCEATVGDRVCTNPAHRGKTSVAKRYESQCIDCIKEKRLLVA